MTDFSMKSIGVGLAACLPLLGTLPGFALAGPNTVDFRMEGSQPSLRDASKNDTFKVSLDDEKITTDFEVVCQAGKTGYLGLVRKDEACQVTGQGFVKNPQNPSDKLPRTQYSGGFTVQGKEDGYTDASSMLVNFLALGSVPSSSGRFGGAFTLLPEQPVASAAQLRDKLLDQLKQKATGGGGGVTIVDAIDSVRLENFATPSGGLPSDSGCVWNGDMIYAYATESWVMDLSARCGSETYSLQGNMPWFDTDETTHKAEYVLNLTLPTAGATSDNALFASASPDDALFANATGISGKLSIEQGGFVEVEIEKGVMDRVATSINATGSFTGNGVPLDLVRSFATTVAVLARTFFGA